jgi:uncharacterized membrane protein YgcG
MHRRGARALIVVVGVCLLTGCGLTIPDIKEVWDADKPADVAPVTPVKITGTTQIEFEIKKQVYCQLKAAVQAVNLIPLKSGPPGGTLTVSQSGLLPLDWGAQVSLSLQVDETSGLTPGVAFNQVLPNGLKVFGPGTTGTVSTAQSFNLGLGGTLSSTATRVDKYDPYWSVAFLMIPNTPRSICVPGNDFLMDRGWIADSSSPFILEGDLGITEWLVGAMQVNDILPSVGAPSGGGKKGGGGGGGSSSSSSSGGGGGGAQPDTVSYEIKFVIVSSGTITPTWKLMRVTANTSGTLFNAGRTRTHDLIITIGPGSGSQAQAAQQTHLASQIGNAVANATRSALQAQQ